MLLRRRLDALLIHQKGVHGAKEPIKIELSVNPSVLAVVVFMPIRSTTKESDAMQQGPTKVIARVCFKSVV